MKLSEVQEEIVRKYVEGHDLTLKTLNEDIIDHLCCVLESELGEGKSFDEVLREATAELAPDGLADLQHKTFYLLNSKRIILMKKLTYIAGFIGSLSFTGGVAFKLLHYPGANQLFIIGYLLLLLVFIPLLAFDRYKVSLAGSMSNRWKIILGVASSVILGLAGVFKVMHLQGAEVLLLSGMVVFAMGFLPFLFFTLYKKSVA